MNGFVIISNIALPEVQILEHNNNTNRINHDPILLLGYEMTYREIFEAERMEFINNLNRLKFSQNTIEFLKMSENHSIQTLPKA